MEDDIEIEAMFESLSDSEKMILLDGLSFGIGFIGVIIRQHNLCDEPKFREDGAQMMSGIRHCVVNEGWGLKQVIMAINGLLDKHGLIELK